MVARHISHVYDEEAQQHQKEIHDEITELDLLEMLVEIPRLRRGEEVEDPRPRTHSFEH